MKKTICKKLSFIGAAINQGQKVPGVELGPKLMRQSGLFDHLKARHNILTDDHGDINIDLLAENIKNAKSIKHYVNNLHLIDPLLGSLHQKVYSISQNQTKDNVILTVGGDHSIGSATISAMLLRYPNLKTIWVDAHPDFVNPDIKGTENQNYHGMPLSHVTGTINLPNFKWLKKYLPTSNVVLIGIRDIDDDQWISLKKYNIKCFTMDHVIKFGIGNVMTMAMEYLDPKGQSPFHISFDIDGCDPYEAIQTGTKFRTGLTHRQACHIVRRVAHQRQLVSMDLVEINSLADSNDIPRKKFRGQENLNQITSTVGLGVDLVQSIFTKYLTL